MSGTAVAGTLTALTTLFSETGLDKVQVTNGPNYDPAGDYLCIGWAGPGVQVPGVTANRDPTDAARGNQENFDVMCLLGISGSSNNTAANLTRAYGLFDQLDAALNAAPRDLGVSGVMRARISAHELNQDVTETGGDTWLHITVYVQAMK